MWTTLKQKKWKFEKRENVNIWKCEHFENLKNFDSIFAAAGHPNAVFEIDFENLKSLTSGVTKEITEWENLN